MNNNKSPIYSPLKDRSLVLLLISNLFAAYVATSSGWNLGLLMWTYWFQSVSIGIINFVRILSLKDFKTDNFYINEKPVEATPQTKNFVAIFFAIHYGLFHLVYLLFLIGASLVMGLASLGALISIGVTAAVFFANHYYSFIYNKETDSKDTNIGHLMFYPYVRIFPMHFAIIGGFLVADALLYFLVLKIIADIIMHIIEHAALRKNKTAIAL